MTTLESEYIELDNHKGLKGVFSTLGAGVRSLTLHGKPLILQMKEEQAYLQSPQLFGKTVSRFIGRIPSTGEIDGVPYQLDEFEPGICVHGGYRNSMIYKNYTYEVVENDQSLSVIFKATSPDGDCGFPGNLNVKVIYMISKDLNILTIKYEAVSDKDTLISLSNHMYWNFAGDENISDYNLQIKASKYGTFRDESKLITGKERVPSYLDFTSGAKLGDKLDQIQEEIPDIGNLDHAFVFDNISDVEPQVILSNDKYQVECYTDFDAVNLYVDSTLVPVDFVNNPHLYRNMRRGIAIEPQQFVLDHFILKANEVYSHFITYSITEK